MCGIAGIFNFDREQSVAKEMLKSMANPISYRGPDEEGYFVDAFVGLAHKRLAIIDIDGGEQPMFNDTNELAIIYNGEIYNYVELRDELRALGHTFRTQSDTEVLLKSYEQWGVDCQQKLNGMWAFAIWDARSQHLFISRDRLGEKPLNYMTHQNSFLFGSEIKSILAYTGDLEPDLEMNEIYMFLGYIPAPYTYYKSVKKLAAGNYLIVNHQGVKEYSYWKLPDITDKDLVRNESIISDQLNELLSDSVRIRMRSDVPYGAFLSGGLDSSSIVAAMSDISSFPVKTFTIGFHEDAFDERKIARIIARKYGTEHHEEVVEKSSVEKSVQHILHHYDEPFADPAAIPTYHVSKSASSKVKMVLTGDGGDEVFAGYSNYQSELFAKRYNRLPGIVRNVVPGIIGLASGAFAGNSRYSMNRMKRVFESFNLSFDKRLLTKFVKIPPNDIRSLMTEKSYPIEEFISSSLKGCSLTDPFYKLTYFHLMVSLPDQMLVKVDKMSMACSLETRAPLLDYRIVELMYSANQQVKMPSYRKKHVKHALKTSMADTLPSTILKRRKQGFEVPLREWFKDEEFEAIWNETYALPGFNGEMIKKLVKENKNGSVDHGKLLWRIMLLQKWLA